MTKINISLNSLKKKVGAAHANKLIRRQAKQHFALKNERDLNRYILSHPEMTPKEMKSLLCWVKCGNSPFRYNSFWEEFNPESKRDYIEGKRKEQLINDIMDDFTEEENDEFFSQGNIDILLEKLNKYEKKRQ